MGNGSTSFVCNKCFVRKPNEYLLKKHMEQHIESICVICQKKFNARNDLKRHTQVHEVQRCEECGKWFSSKKEYRSHRQTHKKKTNDDEEVDILRIDLDTYNRIGIDLDMYNKNFLDFSHSKLEWLERYFGQYCSLIYLVDIMHISVRWSSAACIFFQGGLSPP